MSMAWATGNVLFIMKLFLAWLLPLVALVSSRSPPSSAETKYYLSVQKELAPCENFNNSVVNIGHLVVEKRTKTELSFAGNITVQEDIDDLQYQFDILVDKNNNWEYLDKFEEKDVCKHVLDKDKVWTAFVNEMGLTGCPIKKNTYILKESTIEISNFSLSAKNVGLFRGIAYLLQGGKKISCHFADVSISS